jgi:BirA family biotin operon repressor/biotin-[acetyl-CoA-carboxylase] ligase
MYGECTVAAAQQIGLLRDYSDEQLASAIAAGIEARVASWEQQIVAGAGVAGPLAPVLSEYFDLVALLGNPAEAVYPNGNVMARGTFAGVDIWGRATLVTSDGSEVEFSPEQASIRPA